MEHYARLAPGTTTPAVGKAVEILGTDRGVARLGTLGRGQPTLER